MLYASGVDKFALDFLESMMLKLFDGNGGIHQESQAFRIGNTSKLRRTKYAITTWDKIFRISTLCDGQKRHGDIGTHARITGRGSGDLSGWECC